jgi:hypothetical protein
MNPGVAVAVGGGLLLALTRLLPLSDTNKCVLLHQRYKPWLQGFRRVLIRPLRPVKAEWLGKRVRIDGVEWRVPTRAFWIVHAKASHAGGAGCDVAVHTAWLTATGDKAEFVYGHQTLRGDVVVEERAGFEIECNWWAQSFASWRRPFL